MTEAVVRLVGVVAGLTGTWVTASDGWRLLRQDMGRVVRRARAWLSQFRWLRFLRPEPIKQPISPASEVGITGVLSWDVLRPRWDPTASTSAKLRWLRKEMEVLGTAVQDLNKRISEEKEARAEELQLFRHDLSQDLAALHRVVAETQRRAVEVDARGLPLIAVGLLYTSRPDLLGHFSILGWTFSLLGLTLTVWVAMLHRQDERQRAITGEKSGS